MSSLAEELPKEIARVRDGYLANLIETKALMPPRSRQGLDLSIRLVRHVLDQATAALATGDVVAMLQFHQLLKGYE